MSLNHYKLYLEQVFQLAETIVIKSEDSALILNKRIAYLHGDSAVNPLDKTSWKYYLNLAGKYHPTDEKITITSLDTLQPIEFSSANLLIHTATAKAYQYGTRYYRELLSQHPEREQFILGCLYPVETSVSTIAPDFSVLGYQDSLVEGNEESLINNINAWLENYKTRWYNKQYNLSDNLYLTNLLGVMYQQLVPLILTLRLRSCKTSEAHSYHIREYLASNGMLDEYLDFMTRKQALFFYRNINYIERNAGREETFTWLLEKVLTDRNIPVAEIRLSQSDESLLTSYKPTIRFSRQAINVSTAEDTGVIAFYTLTELLAKEANETPNNASYIRQNLQLIEEKLDRSKTNMLRTKVLESKMIDYTDAGLYSIQDTTLDLWCHMSISGHYSSAINFVNKITNKTLAIPNHIAFLYFLYAFSKINELELETVPELFVHRIAIDPVPTIETIRKVVDKRYVTTEDLEYLISLHTPLESLISTTAFKAFVEKSFVSYKAEHMFAATQNNIYKRALIKNATYRMYGSQREASPYLGQNFEDIFKTFGLQTTNMTKDDWSSVYKEMYEKSTGMTLSLTETQAALQSTMVKLFKKLSSYSIQFLSEINRTTIRSINWSAIRMGDIARYGHDLRRISLPIIKMLKMMSHSSDYRFIELKTLLQKFYIVADVNIGFIDPTIEAWISRPIVKFNINVNTIVPNLHNMDNCAFETPEQLPEVSPYYQLSEGVRRTVRDIYQNKVTDEDTIPAIDIDSMAYVPKDLRTGYQRIANKQLTGFKHLYLPDFIEVKVDREFTDLDAYESNFGELNSRAFTQFKGVEKNSLGFKIMPGPIESVIKSFSYTGDILRNPGFGFSLNLDNDKDIGGFIFIQPPSVENGIYSGTYQTQILFMVYGPAGLASGQLGSFVFSKTKTTLNNFNFLMDTRTINTGMLVAGNVQLAFKINANSKVRIKTDFIFSNYDNVTLSDSKLDTYKFDLSTINFTVNSMQLNFNYGTAWNIGSFYFNSSSETIAFNSTFIKDQMQIGSFNPVISKVEFNTINTTYQTNKLGVFNLSKLNQEVDYTMQTPLKQEVAFIVQTPLQNEIGTVSYDGVLNTMDIS